MDNYYFFFKQGLSHISDIGAYDHILFIVALVAGCNFRQWKHLFYLVTSFTIGHSIALALSTLELVKVGSSLVEFLIPVTIIATCIASIFRAKVNKSQVEKTNAHDILDDSKTNTTVLFHVEQYKYDYLVIVFFGLIHGLGFSNYLRFILTKEEGIFTPLLSFNIGLEIGQILILTIALLINFVLLGKLKVKQFHWTVTVSILIILLSIPLLINTGSALLETL